MILLQKGFTFIELLVGVGISGILISLGISAYNNFNNRQTITVVAQRVRTEIRVAQAKAMANKQPLSGCTNFSGYQVDFNSTNISYGAKCDQGLVGVLVYDFPSNVSLTSNPVNKVLFKPKSQGTDLSSDLVLTLSYQGETGLVTITSSGEIY